MARAHRSSALPDFRRSAAPPTGSAFSKHRSVVVMDGIQTVSRLVALVKDHPTCVEVASPASSLRRRLARLDRIAAPGREAKPAFRAWSAM